MLSQLANYSNVREIAIGLYYNGNNYHWTDPLAAYNYSNWSAGFPNPNSGACVLMSVGDIFNGQWRNIDCSIATPFACSYGDGNLPFNTLTTTLSPSISPPNACPSNPIYQNYGYISSPGYPSYYGGSLECDYYLIVNVNNYVAVKFSDFDLKSGDYVDLYDGVNNIITRLQGNIDLSQWYTTYTSSEMKIVFVSNVGANTNRGWSLYFQSTNSREFSKFTN